MSAKIEIESNMYSAQPYIDDVSVGLAAPYLVADSLDQRIEGRTLALVQTSASVGLMFD